MSNSFVLAVIIALTFAPSSASPQSAQQPSSTTRLVPFSGILTDTAGTPLAGPQAVTFSLFDEAEGGTLLWTETQMIVPDDRGRYIAYLGAGVPLPLEIFRTEHARWLQVSVAGREMPRAMLVAVPYALRAADAETLGGIPLSSFVVTGHGGQMQRADGTALAEPVVDGTGVVGQIAKWSSASALSSSVIAESATNRVGVGLPDPTGGGVVDSVFSIKNFDNNTGLAILNDTQQRRFALNTLANGGWLLYDGANGTWHPGILQHQGRVSIGTTTPQTFPYKLDVFSSTGNAIWGRTSATEAAAIVGDARTSGGGGVGVVGQSETGVGVWAFSDPGLALRAQSPAGAVIATFIGPGGVGIGTDVPADKLDVKGDIRVGTGTTGCVKDAAGSTIAGTCSSDGRFKTNVTAFSPALEAVSALQPVHFDWRVDEFPDKHFGAARSFGLVAQDVEAVLPDLVTTDADGYKAVKYNQLPFYMLQAIKDLKAENDRLKQQLQAQDERLRRLEALAAK